MTTSRHCIVGKVRGISLWQAHDYCSFYYLLIISFQSFYYGSPFKAARTLSKIKQRWFEWIARSLFVLFLLRIKSSWKFHCKWLRNDWRSKHVSTCLGNAKRKLSSCISISLLIIQQNIRSSYLYLSERSWAESMNSTTQTSIFASNFHLSDL